MKLAIIILFATTLQVNAYPAMGQKVNLNLKQTEIRKVLRMIEDDGYYRFLYNSKLKALKTRTDFSAQNLSVTESLGKLFSGSNLTFKLLENNVVVVFSTNEEENDKIKVTGRITGENGEAIAGASVLQKGTGTGTFADNNGVYTLTVDNDATLVISSIGYESQEVKVNNRSVIDIRLVPSVKKSEEVVVIGYGTASRRDLTGSITKVKGDEIAAQPNSNPISSLQNKVAGLSIVNSAVPGSTPDVRIRGTISIGSIRPVYIVDGIFNDNIDFVNPSEIESIEVLKDPSSLAIFGIKGAAGAILVTTKKAKAGQININFNTTYGSKKLVDKIKLANGDEFRNLLTFEANNRVADDPSATSLLSFVNNVGGPGMSAFPGNTDWIDAVTRAAKFSTTNLSLDASTEKNRFHFGLGYTYDEGLVKHVRYDRMTMNINDEFKVSRKWKLGFGLIGSKEKLPYNSGALENARRSLPIVPSATKQFYTKNPYGVDSGFYNLYSATPIIQNSETNPLATLENNYDKKIDDRYRLVGNVYVDINITKDLNFRSTWYADMSWRNNREYTPLYDLYDPTVSGNQVINRNSLTAVRQDLINTRAFQQDYIATYKKKFSEHSLTLTGGFTTYYNYFEQVSGTVSQKTPGVNMIPNNKRFWYLNTGFGDLKSIIPTNQSEYSTVSGLARLLYNYRGKYFLTGSFRRDGASQINREYSKKFQSFWAVGAAWEISRESFMSNVKFVNYLKLKASTGLLGNFTTQGKAYPAYPGISSTSSAVFGDNLIPVYVPDYLFDPNLHWETVNSTEVGLEADLLNSRLHFEAAYYYKKTKDLIVLLEPVGILPSLTNNGSIENKGFEFTASWNQNLMKDLNLVIGGNLTTYKNKVLHLEYPSRSRISSSEQTPNQAQTGYPIGYFYGLVADGIYQSYADILASPVNTINGGGVKPGDLKYKDLNGDGVIDENDRTLIGNPTPDFTYGINLALKYKAFDLGIDFAGSYGNEIYRVWGTSEQKNSVYNYPQYYTEGWTAAGSSNWVPIVNQNHLVNRAPSTYGIEDGSFFRIRNLTLGYTLAKLPKITGIKNLRVTFTVQNLKTWKRNLGYSPEYAGDALGYGMDFGGAGSALPRVMTLGLNVNF
ncbi:MAG: TonB-dependent receptor [Ferruginibacter sp.]|nr:TonB-dependent receptor [Ferruginibacter sp.]MBU9936858.1 TonB-dependent receptor [Ferruginibacter sp.]